MTDLCSCSGEASNSTWWRIGAGAFLAMNAMVLGLAVNGSETLPEERWALELSILCVSGAVLVLLAKEFLEAIWQNLRERRLGIEAMFLVGIGACFAASAVSLRSGAGGTLADAGAMLLVIYSLGRQIGAYGQSRVLHSLADWTPEKRQGRLASTNQQVPVSQIRRGDRLRILPGEAVPVDVRILEGEAQFQEASLTGEAFAVPRGQGSTLSAGVFALDASVEAEALTDGRDSSLEQIRQLVVAGLALPGEEQKIALRALRYFAPATLLIAIATFGFHASRGSASEALFHALSVLVIACPCALGFATPLAVWTAISRLRELGLLARTGQAVEALAEIDTVVFDKTGTLTLADRSDVAIEFEPAWAERALYLRALLKTAEEAAPHPMSKILAPLWEGFPLPGTPALRAVRLIPGRGIEARFADGTEFFAGGNLELRVNGGLAARITRTEVASPSAAPAIAELERAGLRVILSTGDTPERASLLPISTQWTRQTPLDKYTSLAALRRQGRKVLFAGDGLNDVAAMAWSDVSLTIASGPLLLREMSGLLMLDPDWRKLPQAIAIARAARRLVRANIGFSLAYNSIGMGLAAAGLLHPVGAALIMLFSSLTVILFSMRLMDQEVTLS